MNSEALQQLEDIIIPPAVGWWPLAISVWISLISLMGLIVALIWYFRLRHKQRLYRRIARQHLNQIDQTDDQAFLIEINRLLKQVAITTYGRQTCAHLDHQAWLDFLKSKAQFIKIPKAFEKINQRYRTDLPALTNKDKKQIQRYAKRWIERHHL
ncbi:DUF4381 domain-containing protein [Thiomicrospira pelophila]|uniref:DUF4381 domain-containing protein n=1 Tax=Thiomicrospira pelophila TaxID=934 RepID=UPI0004A6E070|nr:DUF4381 domain-containing protein [Thiomicrospira pelophila]